MSEEKIDLDLYSLVTAVREELETMDQERRAQGRQALLQLAEMELEINFVVTKRAGGKGKFQLKVFSIGTEIGADAGIEHEKVQKIKLKFTLASTDREDIPLGARPHSVTEQSHRTREIEPLE
jgi:hypothetical protein